ncbi:Oidioi.mRNA.OKI2018_I69.chr2.g4084.t1.cds [Oikopleura dioica]|uniref:Oidioi.mRNA.OKI2018_I69.chr2.g4084.t1.cds n=1 Tax=Oikopleura dioica TaxID=34765 RepID=A0ABN7T1Q1_OIKDI|nr:Oidioi.mRNA.OKI2018_I69.chr2.g4084.t1.cds [Oikopleura dioica]
MERKIIILLFVSFFIGVGLSIYPLIIAFRKEQKEVQENGHLEAAEFFEVKAFYRGKLTDAIISPTLLQYEAAQAFCLEKNSSMLEMKIDTFMPIPDHIHRLTFLYWIKAEFSQDLDGLEINEEYREKIQNELDRSKARPGYIFFMYTVCNLPNKCSFCLYNEPTIETNSREFEFVCADRVYEDGKILVQVEAEPDCDVLQLNTTFVEKNNLFLGPDNNPFWKRVDNIKGTTSRKILSGYFEKGGETGDIPWCENNPNRLQGAYIYENEVYLGNKAKKAFATHFQKWGKLTDARIVKAGKKSKSRGFAFITFADLESAKKAKEEAHESSWNDKIIRVDYSVTKRGHSPTPGVYKGHATEKLAVSKKVVNLEPGPDRGRDIEGNREADRGIEEDPDQETEEDDHLAQDQDLETEEDPDPAPGPAIVETENARAQDRESANETEDIEDIEDYSS